MKAKEITQILAKDVRRAIEREQLKWEELQEIRLRVGHPVILLYQNEESILRHIVCERDLNETMEYVSNYSLYAYENELRQGFITVEGGHRVGVAGQVLSEHGNVKKMKQISSLNIRISHEVIDCAEPIFPYITYNKQVCHTLIISPPKCGKTTMLRDVIRQISNGNRWVKGCTVGVVDERSELAGCYQGIPQNHVGMRTDVLDCCPKAEGMLMLIRSMAPQVIAVDEIGSVDDVRAMEYAMHCGCKMIATVHGNSMEEIRKKPVLDDLIRKRRFERYIVLRNGKRIGEVDGVYDERGSLIYREVSYG